MYDREKSLSQVMEEHLEKTREQIKGKQIVIKAGITFPQVLTAIFVAAKLANVISWSWWWVLCPLWLPIAIIIGVPLVIFVCAFIFFVVVSLLEWIGNCFKD